MKGDQHRTEKTDWVDKSKLKCKKKKSSKLPEGPAFPLTSLPSNKVQNPVGPEGQGLFQRQQERRMTIKEHPGQGAGKGKNSDLEEMWVKLKRKLGCGEVKLSFRPNPVCFWNQLTQHRA